MQPIKPGKKALCDLHANLKATIEAKHSLFRHVENARVVELADSIEECLSNHLIELESFVQREYGYKIPVKYQPQMKSCGANGPGGRGFMPGNTCGKRVKIGGFSVRVDSPEDALDLLDEEHEASLSSFDTETNELEQELESAADRKIADLNADLEDAEASAYEAYQSKVAEVNEKADDKIESINETIDEKLEALGDDEDQAAELEQSVAEEIDDTLSTELESALSKMGDAEVAEVEKIDAAYEAALSRHPEHSEQIDVEYEALTTAVSERYQEIVGFYYDGSTSVLSESKPPQTQWIQNTDAPGSKYNPPSGKYLQADGEVAARARAESETAARVKEAVTKQSIKRTAYEAERKERIAGVEKARQDQLAKVDQSYDSKIATAKERHAEKIKDVETKLSESKESLARSRDSARAELQQRYTSRYQSIEEEIDRYRDSLSIVEDDET